MALDRRFVCSLLIVVGIAVSQTGSTQFAKSTQADFGDSVNSPLFMTWFGSLMSVVLAVPAVFTVKEHGAKKVFLGGSVGLSFPGFLARVLFFYSAALVANYCYQRAVKMASAALVAALFSTAPAFVAVGSVHVLKRHLPALGWAAVACTIFGSVLVVEPWQGVVGGDSVPAGLLLALLAALAAASYKVAFKFIFDDPSPETVGVILAWCGMYAFTLGTALLMFVLSTGAESVEWNHLPWRTLLLGNLFSLSFNFLIGWGISVSYPLFCSLGTVLNVPLNIFFDWLIRSTLPSVTAGIGILCILCGFFLLLYCDVAARRQQAALLCCQESSQQEHLSEGLS